MGSLLWRDTYVLSRTLMSCSPATMSQFPLGAAFWLCQDPAFIIGFLWLTTQAYVAFCNECALTKVQCSKPLRLFQPLETPPRPWKAIALDNTVKLPQSNGYMTILIVVDHLTKMTHFAPCTCLPSSEETLQLWINWVVPDHTISNYSPQFISCFWHEALRILTVHSCPFSSHHPQMNSQMERVNQTLE